MKDLVIIGGGPGGYVAAIRARQLGLSVTVVEKDRFGGTCLNRGCIPTKAYYRNALAMQNLKASTEFNLQVGSIVFDMPGARKRKDGIVSGLVAGVEKLLQANGVERIKGTATLLDKNTVLVNGERLQARNLLLATGSLPAELPIPGSDLPGVINSDQLLEIEQIPGRLAIIGGGVIGLEFASIFQTLGSQVTVIEYLPDLLNSLDAELGKRLRVFLKKQKITVHTSTRVEKIELDELDNQTINVKAQGKKDALTVAADLVLVATGRKPCTAGLNLDSLGIVQERAGFIQVDSNFATSVAGIYAIGDVIGGSMLAHSASAEGIAAVEKIAGLGEVAKPNYAAVPACVFTLPEIASVGLSEEEAKLKGINYRVGKFQFAANGKAQTLGEAEGMVKVLADEDDVIIGMHIIGPQASDLIMEGTIAVKNRLRAAELAGVIHPHPTLSEAILEAVLDIQGQALHLAPRRSR